MNSLNNITNAHSELPEYRKNLFRFFFIFFLILIFPVDFSFFSKLFSIEWTNFNFYDLFILVRHTTTFYVPGFYSWLIAAALAGIGTAIWHNKEKKPLNYEKLNYWLRVVLRYKLAAGIIAFGFIKLFPLQMPYPSLSNLHTNYGDFLPWKIYFHTIGITQGYESFLGAVEVLAGILLFNRKTTAFGAGIIIGFIGNILAANFAYDIGEQVYSSFLVLIAVYLLAHDVPRLYDLLIKRQKAVADKFKPELTEKQSQLRLALKIAFGLYIVVFGLNAYANYNEAPYKIPKTAGIRASKGFYNVSSFIYNNDTIAYSKTNPNRWQDVVFEKWATISIKIAKPIIIDNSRGEGFFKNDIDRIYESAGVGGRRYFAYEADTVKHTLLLKNKNKNHKEETFELNYSWVNDSTLVLNGIDEKKNTINAVLERINKKYMLFEGRRKPITL